MHTLSCLVKHSFFWHCWHLSHPQCKIRHGSNTFVTLHWTCCSCGRVTLRLRRKATRSGVIPALGTIVHMPPYSTPATCLTPLITPHTTHYHSSLTPHTITPHTPHTITPHSHHTQAIAYRTWQWVYWLQTCKITLNNE